LDARAVQEIVGPLIHQADDRAPDGARKVKEAGASSRGYRVVEVIGPAGAGKSSLVEALAEQTPHVLAADPPHPRSPQNFPFYVRNLAASLPVLARMGLPTELGGHLPRGSVASVVILNGWSARLARHGLDGHRPLVLDQGPLYRLAELHARGPTGLLSQTWWWDAMYGRWGRLLDCVVELDAGDDVLIRRIRDREKSHRLQRMTDPEARRFLASWRGSLTYTLTHLAHRSSGITVLRYDTSDCSPESLAQLLRRDLGAA
jgi:energy-coupling factor transporter ATP-binding protein EcfA2